MMFYQFPQSEFENGEEERLTYSSEALSVDRKLLGRSLKGGKGPKRAAEPALKIFTLREG